MITLLTDFGIPSMNNFGKDFSFDIKDTWQTTLVGLNDTFICPVSNEKFETKYMHDSSCRYRYCKKGWHW